MAKKKPKQPKARYVARQTRKFQLRLDHPIDAHVVEILDYAKSQRSEVTMIRDGVRLLWALKNDNLRVLFELFPHLERQFNPDAEDLIAQFRDMLLQHRTVPVPQPVQIDSGAEQGGRKLLNGAKIDLPLLEDDDDGDTIVLTKKIGSMNGSNLIAGILGLD
jgi:hypothetical protein